MSYSCRHFPRFPSAALSRSSLSCFIMPVYLRSISLATTNASLHLIFTTPPQFFISVNYREPTHVLRKLKDININIWFRRIQFLSNPCNLWVILEPHNRTRCSTKNPARYTHSKPLFSVLASDALLAVRYLPWRHASFVRYPYFCARRFRQIQFSAHLAHFLGRKLRQSQKKCVECPKKCAKCALNDKKNALNGS